jgi:hypothetical protein
MLIISFIGVIAFLKGNILKREELSDGYCYTFVGSDTILDQVLTFIKTERQCCSFLTFNLSIEDVQSCLILNITRPDGAKEFINTEMNL